MDFDPEPLPTDSSNPIVASILVENVDPEHAANPRTISRSQFEHPAKNNEIEIQPADCLFTLSMNVPA